MGEQEEKQTAVKEATSAARNGDVASLVMPQEYSKALIQLALDVHFSYQMTGC